MYTRSHRGKRSSRYGEGEVQDLDCSRAGSGGFLRVCDLLLRRASPIDERQERARWPVRDW